MGNWLRLISKLSGRQNALIPSVMTLYIPISCLGNFGRNDKRNRAKPIKVSFGVRERYKWFAIVFEEAILLAALSIGHH